MFTSQGSQVRVLLRPLDLNPAEIKKILGSRYRGNDTVSGPGWSSILTGVWADKHGVGDNSFRGAKYDQFPHFFARLKQARPEAVTVSLVSWAPIDQHIVSRADIRHVEPLPGGNRSRVDLNLSAGQLHTPDGRWHHLLGMRRGDTISLYLGRTMRAKTGWSSSAPITADYSGGTAAGNASRRS